MFVGNSRVDLSVLRSSGRTGDGCNLGQPKVKNLGMSAFGNEDIRRLDVAMNDAFGVGSIERIGYLDSEIE